MGKSSWGRGVELPYQDGKVTSVSEQLEVVIAAHFHPETGSKYWLKKEKELNLHARKDITDFDDLKAHLGLKGDFLQEFEDAMRYLPIRDMVPRSQHKKILYVGETGGTTGVAKKAAFSHDYWNTLHAFLTYASALHGLPTDGDLLYIGPTGPHAFGFFVMDMAKRGNRFLFTIDLDTRIIKKFISEDMSEASQRYMKHIIEQSIPILKFQDVRVLITTSKILELLNQHLNIAKSGIKGIIHAGTPLDPDTYKIFKEELYVDDDGKSIPLMGLYGNAHSGLHIENFSLENKDYNLDYYSPQPYVVSEVVGFDSGEVVGYRKRGQIVWYRLTPEFLIPGMPERDEGTRIKPAKPFDWDGVQNVDILRSEKEVVIEGVY